MCNSDAFYENETFNVLLSPKFSVILTVDLLRRYDKLIKIIKTKYRIISEK